MPAGDRDQEQGSLSLKAVGRPAHCFLEIFQKSIDNWRPLRYNVKAVANAAIAQSVERILGKDEVASSNLASSSKKKPRTPTGFRLSSFMCYMPPTLKTDTETDTGSFLMQNLAIIDHIVMADSFFLLSQK